METTAPVASAPAPTTKKVTDYILVFNGLFGRNRKVKFTTVKVARVPEGGQLDKTFEALAAEGLAKLGAKTGKWKLDAHPVELKAYSGGLTTESFLLFSEVTVATGAV